MCPVPYALFCELINPSSISDYKQKQECLISKLNLSMRNCAYVQCGSDMMVDNLNLAIMEQKRKDFTMKGSGVLRGTLSCAKQSSAELMATSSYPGHPYKSKPPDPPPPSTMSLFCLGSRSLGTKGSFQMETLFLWKQEGRGGGFVGRLSGVNAKAHLCVGERGSAINSQLFTHQPINCASGALT